MSEWKKITGPPPGLRMAQPFRLKNLRLKNRLIRSSLGGKLGYYDGSPSRAWANFEKRYAHSGVAALISATISVDRDRYSPLQYIKIADDRVLPSMRAAIAHIKEGADIAYFLQIGDPGYQTQASLFPQDRDRKSASPVFDLLYGYPDHATEMTREDIAESVRAHADGARRAKAVGCDGVEITLSKGYLAHQFLNPAVNRRRDEYGGDAQRRFRLAREILIAVRDAVGPDFPVGVRLSTADHNHLPWNVRLPPSFPLKEWLHGNGVEQMTEYAKEIEALGIDWIHLSRGFGFINPKESPGDLPVRELRMVYNTVAHLGVKAQLRALAVSMLPDVVLRATVGRGWEKGEELGKTGKLAAAFRAAVKIPIIANGGFQSRELIESTLAAGHCDLISFARPLLANPDLLEQWKRGDEPASPCTFCNRCSMLTAIVPVGCYDRSRFQSEEEMEQKILQLTVDPERGSAALTGDSDLLAS